MSEVDFKQVKQLFLAALELPVIERDAFLRDATKGDEELLKEVMELLTAHHGDTASVNVAEPEADPEERSGAILAGKFRLLECIGSGGMGTVWMAEQIQPLQRKVALKIIKLGMDTREVIARFETERQALALMDHPNIARVFDAGSTTSGRPFFVMELVKGVPITEFCDQAMLSTNQRLRLFVQVCAAIEHAHRKGIIHRDIKPSNVLVTLNDGVPSPRIIDFGVAKATGQKLSEKTFFTQFRQLLGTPEYMAPEQAELGATTLDIRADIYSLGVLLYELLTGTKPHAIDTLLAAGYQSMLQTIREVEPPKPSTRMSTLGSELEGIARSRRCEPSLLARVIRGDLDWVVMKALEKDRRRRYVSADAFASDVERYLGDQPVAASPPSRLYRIRKFARRRRRLLAVAAAFAVVSVLGLMGTAAAYHRAAMERDRAMAAQMNALALMNESNEKSEAMTRFLTDSLTSTDPGQVGKEITVSEILDGASQRLQEDFGDNPLVEAELRNTLGATYFSVGQYQSAEKHLTQARQLFLEQAGEQDASTLISSARLAALYAATGRHVEAREVLEQVLKSLNHQPPKVTKAALSALGDLASVLLSLGHLQEAKDLAGQGLELAEKEFGTDHLEYAMALANYGAILQEFGHPDSSEQALRSALQKCEESLGREHPSTLLCLQKLGALFLSKGNQEQAQELLQRAFEGQSAVLGEEHSQTLLTLDTLARCMQEAGRLEEAQALHERALQLHQKTSGTTHPQSIQQQVNLASLLLLQGRHQQAQALLEDALDTSREVLGPDHPLGLKCSILLAQSLTFSDPQKAQQMFENALPRVRDIWGEDHPQFRELQISVARAKAQRGDLEESEALLRSIQRSDLRAMADLDLQLELIEVLLLQGKVEEAVQSSSLALHECHEQLGPDHPRTLRAMLLQGDVLRLQGKTEEAESLYTEVLERGAAIFDPEHSLLQRAQEALRSP